MSALDPESHCLSDIVWACDDMELVHWYDPVAHRTVCMLNMRMGTEVTTMEDLAVLKQFLENMRSIKECVIGVPDDLDFIGIREDKYKKEYMEIKEKYDRLVEGVNFLEGLVKEDEVE